MVGSKSPLHCRLVDSGSGDSAGGQLLHATYQLHSSRLLYQRSTDIRMPSGVLTRSRRYGLEVMEPVVRELSLGECIHNVVHGPGYELEGSAILFRRSVCTGSACSARSCSSCRRDSRWRERLVVLTSGVADWSSGLLWATIHAVGWAAGVQAGEESRFANTGHVEA